MGGGRVARQTAIAYPAVVITFLMLKQLNLLLR